MNDQCGVCGGDNSTCGGCTDPSACNYDPAAVIDDGSCILGGEDLTITILTDNYPGETTWTVTDGSGTVWPQAVHTRRQRRNTEQVCIDAGCYVYINDSFGDGICCAYGTGAYTVSSNGTVLASGGEFTATEVTEICLGSDFGCTDATACNYDPAATTDDGSCDFSCYGCTDPAACNYDPAATIDNGLCELPDPIDGCPTCDYPLNSQGDGVGGQRIRNGSYYGRVRYTGHS